MGRTMHRNWCSGAVVVVHQELVVPPNNLLLHLRLWKEMEEGKIWATLEPRAGLKVEQ